MSKILVGKQLIAGQTTPINYTKKIVSLTQSQYDVLVQQGQVEADQLYWITDGTDSDIISDVGVSLDTTYSSQHEQALLDSKANKASTYSKAETDSLINSKLSSALKYKGVVATVADLSSIVDPDNGDSYVVTDEGIMYAYNQSTSQWDALGAPMDLTNYYTKDEVDTIIEDLQIKIQYDTMPQASIDFNYPIQYIGTDTNDYKNGHFYRVVNDGTDYVWEEVIGDSQIIEDVATLPVSGIKDMFYRLANTEQTTVTYDTSAQISEDTIYAMMSPYGFVKGQRYSNYLTSTSQTLQTVVMLTNSKQALVEIVTGEKDKVNFYLYKKDSSSGWNIGCYAVDKAIDRLYLENDTITFWLEDNGELYVGDKAKQTTTKVGSVDADETTIIKNQDGTISVSPDFKKIFNGTEAEWNALTTAEKIQWDEAHIPDATESTDNLWYASINDIDPDWQTNLTGMGALANKFPPRKSVYVNFTIAQGTTASSIGLLPKTYQGGGILHFVTGVGTNDGRAYALFVPDAATNHPYFCEASNWKTNSSWIWKYGDNVYSTGETVTDKVWIDGRPIYRRVLTLSGSVEVGTTQTNISSKLVEKPADILSWGMADVVFIQKTGNFSEGLGVTLNTSTGSINAVSLANNAYTLNAGYHIMIEYTKTAD